MPITLETAKNALNVFTCPIDGATPEPTRMVSIETIESAKAQSLLSIWDRKALEEYSRVELEKIQKSSKVLTVICPTTREELNLVSQQPANNLLAFGVGDLGPKGVLDEAMQGGEVDGDLVDIYRGEQGPVLLKTGNELLDFITAAPGDSVQERLEYLRGDLAQFGIVMSPAITRFFTKTLGFDMTDIKDINEVQRQQEAKEQAAREEVARQEAARLAAGLAPPLPAFSNEKDKDVKLSVEFKLAGETLESLLLETYVKEYREKARQSQSPSVVTSWQECQESGYAESLNIDKPYFEAHAKKISDFVRFYGEAATYTATLSDKNIELFGKMKKMTPSQELFKSALAPIVQANNALCSQQAHWIGQLFSGDRLHAFVDSGEVDPARFFQYPVPNVAVDLSSLAKFKI